jgi:hypothetical protein
MSTVDFFEPLGCGSLGGTLEGDCNPLITLWLFNIAMENGPLIFPLKPPFIRDFPWLC